MSQSVETLPELWMEDVHRLLKKRCTSNFLDQVNGYRITMLSMDSVLDDDDDPDGGEHLKESWTPRFRR